MAEIIINDCPTRVPDGITVAAALAIAGHISIRRSVSGMPRAPVCGMGVCHECRISIDGVRRLACQTLVRDGMRLETEP